ncbi:acyl-coenzyme A thioesterase 9, mitochondrial isoform X1 [Poecilia latipinna]|uniref:acyl-coenzyme A thioesterase 9, mitochondrial isoform X1 n=1 Tax=Poecilia formosa TaxID=48698 RepID=UPI0004441B16|nr:PREDICTED: acyl-coenzyme A thioesterase 9, mitochondrial isoform X1 [Poecilia formosa]XP_014876338.1 PREDICTED: acyl-coenzyme A thioesterase 9, mitochondrial isoform X1 [Poecilia latipinna]
MLSQRFLSLSRAASLTCRSLCSAAASRQGQAPDMAEGNRLLHVSNVRNRLREIVGASTNWSDHQQAMAERVSLASMLARSQSELPAKRMKDSFLEVHLPLGSEPELREKYLTNHNTVRFGRILEDLDSLAVLISYSHTYNPALKRSPLSIVTALVDKIDMRQHVIYPDCDIKFTGQVTWVGRSSIEAKMHMSQYRDGAYAPVLDATFVMVARDPGNKRAAFVNPLAPEGPEEEKLLQEGEANKSRRVELSTASLLKVAPTNEERKIIHDLFLNTLDANTVSFRSRILPPNSVWMEDAKLKGLEICHPQQRNIFNRIFGGFLMRKAYELGWANACSFGGCRPSLVAVDDILFQKPVEIGSLLMLSSQVCYTQGKYIQVRVHSEVFDPLTQQHSTTNIFHYTFASDRNVPSVVPRTYGESMLYLDGKRHFNQTLES